MGALIQAKQIEKFIQAPVYVSGFWFPVGASADVTTALATALATAGAGGTPVPLQAASTGAMGLIVNGNNLVIIYDNATGKRLLDNKGNEVYGRLTGSYTLSLYSKVAGIETAYTLTSTVSIDFAVSYKFNFDKLPDNALTQATAMLKASPIQQMFVQATAPVETSYLQVWLKPNGDGTYTQYISTGV